LGILLQEHAPQFSRGQNEGSESMRNVGQGLALTVLATFLVLGGTPSLAQSLNAAQCRQARAVALDILKIFTGKISAPLARSFARFAETCDVTTQFDTVPGSADDQAFGEFRIQMTVIRTSSGN